MSVTRIIVGCDHAGFKLKSIIIDYLKQNNYEVYDAGTYTDESCDYPIIAKQVANEIVNKNFDKGILICGSGIGMSIAANKVKGIRAAVVSDTCSAKMSRLHNDSNILCMGERIVGKELAKDITAIWLNTGFQGERHQKRIEMLD